MAATNFPVTTSEVASDVGVATQTCAEGARGVVATPVAPPVSVAAGAGKRSARTTHTYGRARESNAHAGATRGRGARANARGEQACALLAGRHEKGTPGLVGCSWPAQCPPLPSWCLFGASETPGESAPVPVSGPRCWGHGRAHKTHTRTRARARGRRARRARKGRPSLGWALSVRPMPSPGFPWPSRYHGDARKAHEQWCVVGAVAAETASDLGFSACHNLFTSKLFTFMLYYGLLVVRRLAA